MEIVKGLTLKRSAWLFNHGLGMGRGSTELERLRGANPQLGPWVGMTQRLLMVRIPGERKNRRVVFKLECSRQ